ncbi:hypothetical protein MMC13_001013 [Lambiella insularis]|nr:hypothetical protein [Lambiella insularis]
MDNYKSVVRQKVWSDLHKVAYPDSRFNFDFDKFIPDFKRSEEAVQYLVSLPSYTCARTVFITPDNCLERLRLRSLQQGKLVLITTYAIRRGFWLLDPHEIEPSRYEYACTLDGMERLARHLQLADMMNEKLTVDLMVTGTGAIDEHGIRFGKGHGFFDLEWAMLYTVGVISSKTPVAGIVHDCQIITEQLVPEDFDTVCDVVITPTRLIKVSNPEKPTCGILWDRLADGMLESIPPLRELKDLIASGKIQQPPYRSV